MKKLIAVLTLLFAFTITANAQNKKAAATAPVAKEKVSSDAAAKKDVAALIAKVTISESLKNDMYTLMVMKHDALSDAKLTAAQKEEVSQKLVRKMLNGLSTEQRIQVEADSVLLNQLSH